MNTLKGTLGENPFQIIKQSDIITDDDFNALSDIKGELKETFLKSQIFRTRTEMEVSVLNDIKFPTDVSKYWQALREQNVMFTELVNLSYEYRKNLIEIKKLERDIECEEDDLEKELKKIDIEKKTFLARNQERVAKDRIREVKQWSDIKNRCAKVMTEDDLADVGNHQLISYTQRWIKQVMVMGENGSPPERQNLFGQLNSAVAACKKEGVFGKVIEIFDVNARKWIDDQTRNL